MSGRPSNAPPHPVDVFVGSRLRAERMTRGWSQTELAKALGVSFQQVQKYEKGTNRISASVVMTACQALKVDPAGLFPAVEGAGAKGLSVQVDAYPGGAELARCYSEMTTEKRSLLLATARLFAAAPPG